MTLNVGHRGSPEEAPENTLASFRLAIRQGAQMVELDTQLNGEGIPMVVHDETMHRVSANTSTLQVSEATLDQLRQADAGALFPAYRGERVPTLEEVLLELCPQIPVNIELKIHHEDIRPLCQGVADLLRRLGLARRVLVSSFHYPALTAIREMLPELVTARLIGPWKIPFHSPHDSWETILAEPLREPSPQLPYRGRTVVLERTLVTTELLERFHQAGGHILTFTVNEEEELRKLVGMGVDAIITNHPALLSRLLTSVSR